MAVALCLTVLLSIFMATPVHAAHCPLHHQQHQVSSQAPWINQTAVSHAADASPVFCHAVSASSRFSWGNSIPFIPYSCCYDHYALLSSGIVISSNPDIPEAFLQYAKAFFISRLPDGIDRPPWA